MRRQLLRFVVLGLALPFILPLDAQPTFKFNRAQPLTNRETLLSLSAPVGVNYRIDAATNLGSTNPPPWSPLVSVRGGNINVQHTDSATPFLGQRFYRAEQLTNTGGITGDYLATTNGDLVIRPLYHASLVMSWNGKVIYSDPDDDPNYESRYTGMPKADLILVTHEHGDHYSSSKITSLKQSNTVVVVPQRVFDQSSFSTHRSSAVVLNYGDSTEVMGIHIQAVLGTNANHQFGVNNCYVMTLGGKRIFISGDTGDVEAIENLTEIDVAFLCMNLPFTMTASAATNVIRRMRPKVVYPYHYRNQTGQQTNAPTFKEWLGIDPGVEVRLRSWY